MSVFNHLLFCTIIGAWLGIVGLAITWCTAGNHNRKSGSGGEIKISLEIEKTRASDIPDTAASPDDTPLRPAETRNHEKGKHEDSRNHSWDSPKSLLDEKAVGLTDSLFSEGLFHQRVDVCSKSLLGGKKTSHDAQNHPGESDGWNEQILSDGPGQDTLPHTPSIRDTADTIFTAMEAASPDLIVPFSISQKEKMFHKRPVKPHASHTNAIVSKRSEDGRTVAKPRVRTSHGSKYNNLRIPDRFAIGSIAVGGAEVCPHVHEAGKGNAASSMASAYKGSSSRECEIQVSRFETDKSSRWFSHAAQERNTTMGESVKDTKKESAAKVTISSIPVPQLTKAFGEKTPDNSKGKERSLQSTGTKEPLNYVRSSLFCDYPESQSPTSLRNLQVKKTSLKHNGIDLVKTGTERDRGIPQMHPSTRHARPVPVAFPVPRTLDFTPGLLFSIPRPFAKDPEVQVTCPSPESSKQDKDVGIFTRVAPWVAPVRGPPNGAKASAKRPVVPQQINFINNATVERLPDPIAKEGSLIVSSHRVFAPREQKNWFPKAKKGLDFKPDHLFRNPRPFPKTTFLLLQVPESQPPQAKTLDKSSARRKRVIQDGSLENPMVGRVKLVSKLPGRDSGFTYKTWTNVGVKRTRGPHQCQEQGGCRICD